MHWYTGVVCLIAVMVIMYLFIRGAQTDYDYEVDSPRARWKCKRCGKVIKIGQTADCERGPCPMDLEFHGLRVS